MEFKLKLLSLSKPIDSTVAHLCTLMCMCEPDGIITTCEWDPGWISSLWTLECFQCPPSSSSWRPPLCIPVKPHLSSCLCFLSLWPSPERHIGYQGTADFQGEESGREREREGWLIGDCSLMEKSMWTGKGGESIVSLQCPQRGNLAETPDASILLEMHSFFYLLKIYLSCISTDYKKIIPRTTCRQNMPKTISVWQAVAAPKSLEWNNDRSGKKITFCSSLTVHNVQ